MQQNINKREELLFSASFLEKFTNAINEVYHYERYMDFMIVPSLFGKKTLSYLPLLSYTDRDKNSVDDLLELSKDNDFNIRVLNFEYDDFKVNDTVTMRIDLDGCTSEEIFASLKKQCRQSVRKSQKHDFTFSCNHNQKSIDDFYVVYSKNMHIHGTPSLSKSFFISLAKEFKDEILFFNVYYSEKIILSYCILLDNELAWGAWEGVDQEYKNMLVGYFGAWESIKYVCEHTNIKIYDFGRSPYLGGTYIFKSKFGAYPVKIDILTSQEENIYEKYSLASQIWKRLPKSIVDRIGPKLCKYLVDL